LVGRKIHAAEARETPPRPRINVARISAPLGSLPVIVDPVVSA